LHRKALAHVMQHRLFATKKMRRTGYIQQDAIIAVRNGPRAPTPRPMGKPGQEGTITPDIRSLRMQVRVDRLHIDHTGRRLHTPRRRSLADRMNNRPMRAVSR